MTSGSTSSILHPFHPCLLLQLLVLCRNGFRGVSQRRQIAHKQAQHAGQHRWCRWGGRQLRADQQPRLGGRGLPGDFDILWRLGEQCEGWGPAGQRLRVIGSSKSLPIKSARSSSGSGSGVHGTVGLSAPSLPLRHTHQAAVALRELYSVIRPPSAALQIAERGEEVAHLARRLALHRRRRQACRLGCSVCRAGREVR